MRSDKRSRARAFLRRSAARACPLGGAHGQEAHEGLVDQRQDVRAVRCLVDLRLRRDDSRQGHQRVERERGREVELARELQQLALVAARQLAIDACAPVPRARFDRQVEADGAALALGSHAPLDLGLERRIGLG